MKQMPPGYTCPSPWLSLSPRLWQRPARDAATEASAWLVPVQAQDLRSVVSPGARRV